MEDQCRKGEQVECRDGERWRLAVVRKIERWPAKGGGTIRMVTVHPLIDGEPSSSVYAVAEGGDDIRRIGERVE